MLEILATRLTTLQKTCSQQLASDSDYLQSYASVTGLPVFWWPESLTYPPGVHGLVGGCPPLVWSWFSTYDLIDLSVKLTVWLLFEALLMVTSGD
jgi:hypothetical protein